MKNFALIGAAGYIAPRHLKAIKDTNNSLLAALDRSDNVGIMDSFFPKAAFFTEFERFDRYIDRENRNNNPIDYISVCTPNYLHDSHIRFGLKNGADVICEKPIVLNPWNIEALLDFEKDTGKRVYSILQLRLHPAVIALKKEIENSSPDKVFNVDLSYITSRGLWYYTSWKGDVHKSGGIATNIGVHFFDMLTWIFGDVKENQLHLSTHDRAAGYLQLKKANVKWFLSINENTLPETVKQRDGKTYRAILIDGKEFEFSDGFTELHTQSYQQILEGNGFGIAESYNAIKIVQELRTMPINFIKETAHPFTELPIVKHPFER